MSERAQRRLAAIVAADVAGYSRLIGVDEEGTLRTLRAHRSELIDPLIAEHGGRVANTAGDSLLLEFPSVVDAVRASVAVQEGIAQRNREIAEDRRILFRIGINVGDVVAEGEDLLGDGVNVAARIEGLADAGGICLSRSARDQVRDRLDLELEDLGEVEVKNVARPVRVFRVKSDGAPGADASTDASAADGPPVPNLPSIAVLPFTNMSDDPEQEFFADGISEDIITELARYPDLIVIARNSSFTFKGQAVKIQEVSRELGARYVLEGSVRKGGQRVRITAQLIDGTTGDHVWAERYDRSLTDVFEVQDEITQTVVASVPERIASAELDRVKRKPPGDMSAYEYVLRGKRHHHKSTPEDNAEALRMLDAAIELDPEYASAYAWKACTLGQAVALGCGGDPQELLARDLEAVQKGLSLDENDIECHRILCEFGMARSQWEDARRHHDKAFEMNPNDPRLIAQRGELLTKLGQAEEGVGWVQKAMQLDPLGADARAHLLGRAMFGAGQYADAVAAFQRIGSPRPDHYADMAACYARLGQAEDARACTAKVSEMQPDFSAGNYVERRALFDDRDRDYLRDALREAGLPE
jgi:adenylate cyclase